jgi:hypothetical protein
MPTILEHIVDKLPHFRIVIDDKNRAPVLGHAALLLRFRLFSLFGLSRLFG